MKKPKLSILTKCENYPTLVISIVKQVNFYLGICSYANKKTNCTFHS